ncbi:MAG: hypothetical protein ABWK05_03675 [Pyrobaculum sp.]
MTDVERKRLATLALYMLEELALRRRGRVRLRYWKTYRMAQFWLGEEAAKQVVSKLIEGGYVKVEGDYVVLVKQFTVKKSLNAVLKDAYNLLVSQKP